MADVTLHLGDCLEYMRTMPAGSVDAVITDPPYGINFPYKSYVDSRENLVSLISQFMPEVRRIAKRVVVFCGVNNIQIYPVADWVMSWSWNTTVTYGAMGYNQWQPVLFYGKDLNGFGSINGILKSDSVKMNGGGGIGFMRDKSENEHICSKPLNVMRIFINRLSDSGEKVFDPFMGGGTTGVAAVQLGRKFIGCEINPDYFKIAEKRIKQAQLQPALFVHERQPEPSQLELV